MPKHTDKAMLAKGIKFLAISLPLLFLSPYLLTITFLNKGHNWYYIGFALGVLVGAGAIFFIYKALRTFIKAMFG